MHIRNILATSALATVAVVSLGSAANASVTETFIGKGDVQTAYHYTNKQMQDAVGPLGTGVTFTSQQPAAQDFRETVSQPVSKTNTETLSWDLSCTVNGKKQSFHNEGTKTGTATGTATGTRTGSRTGSLDGVLNASINAEARKTGQWTGWNIKGFKSGPTFKLGTTEATTTPDFTDGTISLGEFSYSTTWGDWQAEPGENPADCLRNDTDGGQPVVTDLDNVVTSTDSTEGEVVPMGDVTVVEGSRVDLRQPYGTGPAKVFATIGDDTRAIN